MAAWIQHKCATINVYVLEQVLELVVDNFHRRVPRWTDLGTFIRLLAPGTLKSECPKRL